MLYGLQGLVTSAGQPSSWSAVRASDSFPHYPLDDVTTEIQGNKTSIGSSHIVIAGPDFAYSGTLTALTSNHARRFAAQVNARAARASRP